MRIPRIRSVAAAVAVLSLIAACGSDDGESAGNDPGSSGSEESPSTDSSGDGALATDQTGENADREMPVIVVTTNVLGDVVRRVVGSAAEVVTVMPVGADPHDFQASAQEVDALNNADALIVNGAGFEEGLLDVIESAELDGVATFEAISAVETIDFSDDDEHNEDDDHEDDEHEDADDGEDHDDDGGDEHDEEHDDDEDADHDGEDHDDDGDEHDDEDHEDEDHDDHDHSGVDPHFFTDPVRMSAAVEGIVAFLHDEIDFVDPASVDASAAAYIAELAALDVAVANMVESIPEQRRVLVTNHEVFGYFADRYGFEVVGAVIPGGSTTDSASAGELAALAEQVEAVGAPAIFADTSSADDLIEALASEVGDVAIVELYSESLGEAGSDGATYLEMVFTNAERISAALS